MIMAANVVGTNQVARGRVSSEVTNTTQANKQPRMNAVKAIAHQLSGNSSDAETVAKMEENVSMVQVVAEVVSSERSSSKHVLGLECYLSSPFISQLKFFP